MTTIKVLIKIINMTIAEDSEILYSKSQPFSTSFSDSYMPQFCIPHMMGEKCGVIIIIFIFHLEHL